MKEIQLNGSIYLLIEVPDDSYEFKFVIVEDNADELPYSILRAYHKKGLSTTEIQEAEDVKDIVSYEIISTTKDITEEQAKSLVESQIFPFRGTYYKDYTDPFMSLETAKESLQSLIQANGLDLTKNYLILKKL